MNTLTEAGVITELACGSNISYILRDSASFSPTEYKVLQGTNTVPCMKMTYNGSVQLYYMTKGSRPFSSLFYSLDDDTFLSIVSNLLSTVIQIKTNGFLSLRNIDLSFDHVYVDTASNRVSLLYLPIVENFYEDNGQFENDLRSSLIKLIGSMPSLSSPRVMQLSANLANTMMSLESLNSWLVWDPGGFNGGGGRSPSGPKKMATARMVSMNLTRPLEFNIVRDSFIIGRLSAQEGVDGTIPDNRGISRKHCRIDRGSNGQFCIVDLNSKYGTFVNNVRLTPDIPQALSNGDSIRLTNVDFQIFIG